KRRRSNGAPGHSAAACCEESSEVATGAPGAAGGGGGRPNELTKARNFGLTVSASRPAVTSMALWSAGRWNRVPPRWSAAERSGPRESNEILLIKNSTSRQFQPGGTPKRCRSASDKPQRQLTKVLRQSAMVASKAE